MSDAEARGVQSAPFKDDAAETMRPQMPQAPRKILVTGGAGFIGSAVVRQYLLEQSATVINVDKLSYAGNLESLAGARDHPRHLFEHVDICDRQALDRVFRKHCPDAVMHLAAESHVDRSINHADIFVKTNVLGTYTLLEAARAYWSHLGPPEQARFRFHHVSTDEVYGDLTPEAPAFTEASAYAPSSPYSATKAASDHLVRAWYRTYGLPVVISNCSNNYGPCQNPEKLIPLTIRNALRGAELPIYGSGQNVRDWLYVEDHARALRAVLARGRVGRTYNIGGQAELTNLSVVQQICSCLDELAPSLNGPFAQLIRYVADRPGHDARYAIDNSRIIAELGWRPQENFRSGLRKTIRWYLDNGQWVARAMSGPAMIKPELDRHAVSNL